MNQFIVFIVGVILGGVAGWFFARRGLKQHSDILKNVGMSESGDREEGKETLIERQAREKTENKNKILEFAQGKEKITNNNVEKLLGVSNATAERYLDELEKAGILKQIGDTGHYTHYVKI